VKVRLRSRAVIGRDQTGGFGTIAPQPLAGGRAQRTAAPTYSTPVATAPSSTTTVELTADPHRFDADHDGVGCES
jgi:hypothetical protein